MPHRGHETPLRVGPAALDGECIQSSRVEQNATNGSEIRATLTADCAPRFTELTTASVGKQIALVVNGEVYMAPQIMESITSGRFTLLPGQDGDAETLLKTLTTP
ncbi:MAG: hypothetical protein AAFV53_01210 [Myxococcota bacterium]